MRKHLTSIIVIIISLSALAYVGYRFSPFMKEQYRINACAKESGKWDFAKGECRAGNR